ncbi:hypothetical protein C1884_10625 [Pseudomonas sp. GW460-R15]|nr:hypothetical protein C1887_09210 [Pseudomonas sp. GW456-R21]POA68326.1 hypothetical protein C1884_10625 [Pseudomonas sp. GW460-R15]
MNVARECFARKINFKKFAEQKMWERAGRRSDAREGGLSANINVECESAFASKPAPTVVVWCTEG